jgi:peptide deformylase
MVKKILQYPNSFLRKPTNKILFEHTINKNIIWDCIDTVKNCGGLALAANQIGYSSRFFVLNSELKINKEIVSKFGTVFINPEILMESNKLVLDDEGCLSFPNLTLPIYRAKEIKLSFLNIDYKKFEEKFENIHARVMLHECDHLDGKLFTEHLKNEVQDI